MTTVSLPTDDLCQTADSVSGVRAEGCKTVLSFAFPIVPIVAEFLFKFQGKLYNIEGVGPKVGHWIHNSIYRNS